MPFKPIQFAVFGRPEPQGSKNAWVLPTKNGGKGRAIMYDQNAKKMKPYRQEVSRAALATLHDLEIERPLAGEHVPVSVELNFFFAKPKSTKKSVLFPAVKPDVDKLIRSTFDALTGVLFKDDAQVVVVTARKFYDALERVEIRMISAGDVTNATSEKSFALTG
jgi:crossover junction endodeoxyribonuclease RusA